MDKEYKSQEDNYVIEDEEPETSAPLYEESEGDSEEEPVEEQPEEEIPVS